MKSNQDEVMTKSLDTVVAVSCNLNALTFNRWIMSEDDYRFYILNPSLSNSEKDVCDWLFVDYCSLHIRYCVWLWGCEFTSVCQSVHVQYFWNEAWRLQKFQLALCVLKECFQRNVLHFKCFKMLNFNIMFHYNCPYLSCNQTHDHINSVIEKFKKN